MWQIDALDMLLEIVLLKVSSNQKQRQAFYQGLK